MQRWAVTTLALSLVALCAVLSGMRWQQLAQRAPQLIEPVRLSAALPALAKDGAPADGENADAAVDALASPDVEDEAASAGDGADTAPATADAPAGPEARRHETSAAEPGTRATQPGADSHTHQDKPAPPRGPINLNTASAQQLTALPGIGEVLAGRIVAYRQAHGPFKSVDDLLAVDGIGAGKLKQLRPYASVGAK
jgi:competence protein ComEA